MSNLNALANGTQLQPIKEQHTRAQAQTTENFLCFAWMEFRVLDRWINSKTFLVNGCGFRYRFVGIGSRFALDHCNTKRFNFDFLCKKKWKLIKETEWMKNSRINSSSSSNNKMTRSWTRVSQWNTEPYCTIAVLVYTMSREHKINEQRRHTQCCCWRHRRRRPNEQCLGTHHHKRFGKTGRRTEEEQRTMSLSLRKKK